MYMVKIYKIRSVYATCIQWSLKSLEIKESIHIEQLKPELNKQVEQVSLSLHF